MKNGLISKSKEKKKKKVKGVFDKQRVYLTKKEGIFQVFCQTN